MHLIVFVGLLSLAAMAVAENGTQQLHSVRHEERVSDYSPSDGSANAMKGRELVEDYWQEEIIDKFQDIARKDHSEFLEFFRQLDKEHPAWWHGFVYWWHTSDSNKTAFAYNTWGSGPCPCCGGSYDRQYYAYDIPGYYYYYVFREPAEDSCRNNRSLPTARWMQKTNIEQKFQQWVTEQEKDRPPITTTAYVKDKVIGMSKTEASFRVVIVTYTDDNDLVVWKDAGVNTGSFRLQAKGSNPKGTYTMFLIQ